MATEPAYSIDVEEDDIVVRLRRDFLTRDEVSTFLDYLELESIRRRSKLSDADATALTEEIDRAVWERTRSYVREP